MPAKTIADNAGVEGAVIVGKLLESDETSDYGYNAAKGASWTAYLLRDAGLPSVGNRKYSWSICRVPQQRCNTKPTRLIIHGKASSAPLACRPCPIWKCHKDVSAARGWRDAISTSCENVREQASSRTW